MKNSLGATGFTYRVAAFFPFTAPQMTEACQQLICSNRQKSSGALHPPKMFSQFSANSWSQHVQHTYHLEVNPNNLNMFITNVYAFTKQQKRYVHFSIPKTLKLKFCTLQPRGFRHPKTNSNPTQGKENT